MRIEDINEGDPVIYIPDHLLVGPKEDMIHEENLGRVVVKNRNYVFVRYINSESSKATKPENLYSLKQRPDLIAKIPS